METIFSLSNILVMPFWFLMIALPRWRWTERIIKSPWISAPVALLYAALVLPQLGSIWSALANPTLSAMTQMLGNPSATTIAWIHFLTFDLFVGRWAYLDGRKHNRHPLLMAPILFFILMLGPVGFLLYLGVQTAVVTKENQ